MQQQQPVNRVEEFKNFLGWVHFFARALAMSVELFLHQGKSFGERYLGPQGVVAGAIMFFFPVFWPEDDPEPMLWFLAAYLVLWMGAKVGIARRIRKGEPEEHSYYTGRPRLLRLTGGRAEMQIKSSLEPALAFIAGMVICGVNPPLGSYLMLAGVGLGISVTAIVQRDRMRVIDMNDAMLEQRRLSEQWRRDRRW